MAIQTVDLTVPGGDTPRSANTKINANFADATHAASRLVGTGEGQLITASDVLLAANNKPPIWCPTSSGFNADTAEIGHIYLAEKNVGSNMLNLPPRTALYFIETKRSGYDASGRMQIAIGDGMWVRSSGSGADYGAWTQLGGNNFYDTTTAAGANTVIDVNGKLMRSTSSEQYKNILAPLELDDARYADAMALKPIVYRSTADADNPLHHYYSFSAEELGAYDPAFTLWRYTEQVTDANGVTTEQPLAVRQAEGININALLAMSHAIAIKQDKMIKAQDEAIATLTGRIDAMTT